MLNQLELGAIYITDWDKRPFRVVGFDEYEVFYDCLWSDNKWTFSGNFNKKVSFYSISNTIFLKRSKKIDILPFTPEEFNAFRPDLPLRLGRTTKFSWNDFPKTDLVSFNLFLESTFDIDFYSKTLQTDSAILLPYGTKGGIKKGETINADNMKFITLSELIWKSNKIQAAVNKEKSNGIGIYRSGFEKAIPSYYIGEFIDKAGFIND